MYYDIFRCNSTSSVYLNPDTSGGTDSPMFVRIHRNTVGWQPTTTPTQSQISQMIPNSSNLVATFYAWSGMSVSVERAYSAKYYYKIICSRPGYHFNNAYITGNTGATQIYTYGGIASSSVLDGRCLSVQDFSNTQSKTSLTPNGKNAYTVTVQAQDISGFAVGTLNYLTGFTIDERDDLPVIGDKIFITTASTSGYTNIAQWKYLGWTKDVAVVSNVDYANNKIYATITGSIGSSERAYLVGWEQGFFPGPEDDDIFGSKVVTNNTLDDNEVYLKDAAYWTSNNMRYGNTNCLTYNELKTKIIAFNLSADTTFNVTSSTYSNECVMLYPGSGATKVDGPYLYIGFSGRTHFDEAEIQYVMWREAAGPYTDLGVYPCVGTGRFHFSARTATAYNVYPVFTTTKMPATVAPQGYDFAALVRSKRNNKWTPWAFTRTSASLVPASSSTLYIYCDNVVGDAWEALLNLRVNLTSYSSSTTGLPPSGASVTLYVGAVTDQDFKNNKSGGTYTATATGYSSYTGVTALTQTTKSSASLPVYIKTWWMDSPELKTTITRSKGAAALSTAITQQITVTSFTKTFTFSIVHTWTTMSTNQTVYYLFYFSGGNSSHWGDKTFSKNLTYSSSASTTSITFDFSYSYYCVGNIQMIGRAKSTTAASYTTGSWNTTHTFAMTTDSITWVGKENGIQWSSRPS